MKLRPLFAGLLIFIAGSVSGFFISGSFQDKSTNIAYNRIRGNEEYPYINQSYDSESVSELTQGETKILKFKINEQIEKETGEGNIKHISVYYRDLNNGPWIGINEKEEFSPASLLKVPLMIAIFKQAEKDKSILTKKIMYKKQIDDGITQDVVPSLGIIKGSVYTVEDLIFRMIVYSDNAAKNLLLTELNDVDWDKTYHDLGINIPGIVKPEDFMNVRTYASFFRILYNSSYLTKDLSNKALLLLSQVEFKKGITAGVPEGIKVSHKFGERQYGGEIKQLHDCGIIYKKDTPYVLCVMTRGYDWDKLSDAIKNISKITYTTLSD